MHVLITIFPNAYRSSRAYEGHASIHLLEDQSLEKLAAPSLGRTAKVASADMSADSIYQMQEHRLSVGHIVQLFDCPRARGHVHPLAVLPCKHCAPCKAATRHICQDMVCANGAFALRQFMGIQIGGGIQCRSSTKRRSG
jgi:hypothetical protein